MVLTTKHFHVVAKLWIAEHYKFTAPKLFLWLNNFDTALELCETEEDEDPFRQLYYLYDFKVHLSI